MCEGLYIVALSRLAESKRMSSGLVVGEFRQLCSENSWMGRPFGEERTCLGLERTCIVRSKRLLTQRILRDLLVISLSVYKIVP